MHGIVQSSAEMLLKAVPANTPCVCVKQNLHTSCILTDDTLFVLLSYLLFYY